MRAPLRYLAMLATVGLVSVAHPAIAAAVPQCTNTTPTTTQCERPGNTQINTSPPPNNNYPFGWPWWGWGGGITIGLGGI
ncbi:MAG: hypothetical protein JO152_13700 [Mycobacteriaceae bacterium]|nr:hypothetical protein [Mycobacteriaceae bacterium]